MSPSSYVLADEQLYYINLLLEEKRKLYACGSNFVTLDKILTWAEESREYDTVGNGFMNDPRCWCIKRQIDTELD